MAQASVLDLDLFTVLDLYLFNIFHNSLYRILQSSILITAEEQTKLESTYYVKLFLWQEDFFSFQTKLAVQLPQTALSPCPGSNFSKQ